MIEFSAGVILVGRSSNPLLSGGLVRGERKKKKSKKKTFFAESGTRTPTLPFTGSTARNRSSGAT